MSQMYLLLDPCVLVLPAGGNRQAVLDFCLTMGRWYRVFQKFPDKCAIAFDCIKTLWASELYPTKISISKLLRDFQIEEVSMPEVQNFLVLLERHQPYLEDRVGIREVVLHDSSTCDPRMLLDRLGPDLGNSFLRVLFLASTAVSEKLTSELPIVGASETTKATGGLELKGEVVMYERTGGALFEGILPIRGKISVVGDVPDEFYDIDYTLEYRRVSFCVECQMRSMNMSQEAIGRLEGLRVGPEYIRSVEGLGIHNQAPILRRLSYLSAMAIMGEIDKVSGADLHPVRTGIAAAARQVERVDGAKLWRCKVTQEGAGFRLHFWRLGKLIELQKVVVESEI